MSRSNDNDVIKTSFDILKVDFSLVARNWVKAKEERNKAFSVDIEKDMSLLAAETAKRAYSLADYFNDNKRVLKNCLEQKEVDTINNVLTAQSKSTVLIQTPQAGAAMAEICKAELKMAGIKGIKNRIRVINPL